MSQNILIVDDEADLVQLYKIVLEMAGFAVSGTTSGAKALSKVKEQVPDLILLDVMMPGITGIEVCHQVRNMPLTKQPIIVMYSANDSLDNKQRCREAGADKFIDKIVPMQIVTEQIKSALHA